MIKYYCNICGKELPKSELGVPDCVSFHAITYAKKDYLGGHDGHLCKRCSKVLFGYPYEKGEKDESSI